MDVKPYIEKLRQYIESENFAGYDPYDALNSPILDTLSSNSKYLRIFFTQSLKRLPINIRPALGILKGVNPKGIGLFLEGYCKLYKISQNEEYLSLIQQLIELLEDTRSRGFSGNCWGYNFKWQSRIVYKPPFTPTIVNTSFIGNALLDAYEASKDEKVIDLLYRTKSFYLNDLKRKKDGDTFCFSYSPVDEDYVHNANALGASFLIRLSALLNDEDLRQIAYDSMGYCIKYQRENGAWPFAETKIQNWVDSFHTGFLLEAIRRFIQLENNAAWRKKYEKGVQFYADNFFLSDGTPKYFNNRAYPVDIHSSAEAIYFFAGESKDYKILTERILDWTLKNMYDHEKGSFYFQKSKFITNRISYMRWSQAWMFRALTEYFVNNSSIEN